MGVTLAYLGNILGILETYLGHILIICFAYIMHIWAYIGPIFSISSAYIGPIFSFIWNILSIYWPYLGHILCISLTTLGYTLDMAVVVILAGDIFQQSYKTLQWSWVRVWAITVFSASKKYEEKSGRARDPATIDKHNRRKGKGR